jgi:hypothetical protein
MQFTRLFLLVVAALFASGSPLIGQTTDPQLGTWKLNPAKSKMANPAAKPQQVPATLVISPVEGGHHFISDFVDSEGRKVHTEYTAKYDGKEYPRVNIVAGVPASSTISVRAIDSHTYEYTFKGANGQQSVQRTVISRDGKTRTNTTEVTLPGGQKGTNVVVYDKQ